MSTSFPTQRLGATDMRITRVGFGAWAIGGPGWSVGWGAQDDGESIRAIRHAVNRGINWIDTAAVYGLGHSESLVGRALAGMPPSERPYVFTKGGLVGSPADPMAKPRRIGAPDSLRREVEASLRRLGVEAIDLYQMHWPAGDGTPLEVYWQALLDLRQAGKVRHVGLSNHNLAQVQAAEQLGHVETLQPPFSAIRRESAADLLPWCASHDTGVIVYSPMQSGLLSGAFSAERAAALPEGDWRARNAEFMAPRLAANLEFADALKPIAQHHGASVGAIAVAWALAWPGVTGAIAGARSAEQVDGWLGAATLELDSDDMRQIADALARTGVGGGPLLPPPDEAALALTARP
ncbi:aldo/keto reductase [Bordetella pertussis]|uniref:Aldo/keto reductase n=45 Tax=Alcaligenaceae TaxID=506 RepID=Q7VZ90_BORPE|nr:MULTISPECIES: aldo/keto reductase [Bordetella]ETH39044.1 oxidoreductase, aldo/keto reductase family protein [Bordetella pertussis H918]ETH42039.1 oxidoreductase, aldo/keto reductase family protein [Bordetella pertussis H939]ETH71638.1 oxidoreductase, aldo/keto reductase family protein [Bordetella pertussis STO1-CHLA-0011]ETH84835.1 oxidoreductase, aldo/keto reductase family protein [Bordetella pertussis STO1-CHOC-0017]ETH87370.1 oxidoreductase, aldo/keto reductase family protein [Bordetella